MFWSKLSRYGALRTGVLSFESDRSGVLAGDPTRPVSHPVNVASDRLAGRMGFTREGVLRPYEAGLRPLRANRRYAWLAAVAEFQMSARVG